MFNIVRVFREGYRVFNLELLGIYIFIVVVVRLVFAIRPVQVAVRVIRGIKPV